MDAASCSLCSRAPASIQQQLVSAFFVFKDYDDEADGEFCRSFAVCDRCDVVCTSHRSKLDARMMQAFADAADIERDESKAEREARRLRWKRVRSAVGALKKYADTLPAAQCHEYRELIRGRFGTDDIDDPQLQWLCSFDSEVEADDVQRILSLLSFKEQQLFLDMWKAHWYQLFKSHDSPIPKGWHSRSIPIHELLKRRQSKTRFQPILGLPTPVYQYDASSGLWKEALAPLEEKPYHADRLRIITFNVLFDLYHGIKDLIHTHKRTPYICDMLRDLDADIIGLQEVTPPFLSFLLEQEWVKEKFYISEQNFSLTKTKATKRDIQSTIYPSGQLLLAKIPFRASVYAFSGYKRLVCGEFYINDRHICVPVLHLTSEKAEGALSRRADQLQVILRAMRGEGMDSTREVDSIIMGDFNFKNDAEESKAIPADFVDAWLALRPDEDGFTFNPHTNLTANLTSQSKCARRFDRILIRSSPRGDMVWRPTSIELLATEPIVWRERRAPTKGPCVDESSLNPQETEDLIVEFSRDEGREVYEFPPTLNNFQRMIVHRVAGRLGLDHYSAGEEAKGTRCVVIAKKKASSADKKKERHVTAEGSSSPSSPTASSSELHDDSEPEVELRIHPSDHFGLICALEFGPLTSVSRW